jgi:transcriptional regulator of arginine metabolism
MESRLILVLKRLTRKNLVREIVRGQPIRTQNELVSALAERGLPVTQATISRDIAEMGLRKLGSGHYVLPEDMFLRQMLSELTVELTVAQNLVVLKTSSGTAQGVAAALDAAALEEIIGSIAGDDTILIVCADTKKAQALLNLLENYRHQRDSRLALGRI